MIVTLLMFFLTSYHLLDCFNSLLSLLYLRINSRGKQPQHKIDECSRWYSWLLIRCDHRNGRTMRTPLVSSSCASRLDLLVDKLSCLSRILQLIVYTKTFAICHWISVVYVKWINMYVRVAKGVRDNRERNAPLRTIFVNHKRPTSYSGSDEPLNYANNEMITSKVSHFGVFGVEK